MYLLFHYAGVLLTVYKPRPQDPSDRANVSRVEFNYDGKDGCLLIHKEIFLS